MLFDYKKSDKKKDNDSNKKIEYGSNASYIENTRRNSVSSGMGNCRKCGKYAELNCGRCAQCSW